MNLKLTKAIMHDFGKFLELSHGSLMMFFVTEIPESFLPYPKEKIEEALTIALRHFYSKGEEETVRNIEFLLPALQLYVDDEKAIKLAFQRMENKEWKAKLLEARRERQKQLFEELEKKFNL